MFQGNNTYNLLLLAEESVALQGLVELTLRHVRKHLVLSFIGRAVGDSGRREKKNEPMLSSISQHGQSERYNCAGDDE